MFTFYECPPQVNILRIAAYWNTVWKLQDCFVIQILREINFGVLTSSKTAIFALSETQNFVDLVISAFKKCKNV